MQTKTKSKKKLNIEKSRYAKTILFLEKNTLKNVIHWRN